MYQRIMRILLKWKFCMDVINIPWHIAATTVHSGIWSTQVFRNALFTALNSSIIIFQEAAVVFEKTVCGNCLPDFGNHSMEEC